MGAGLELAGLRRDGSEFPVDISLSAIETDEGQLASAFIRDITERRAIRRACGARTRNAFPKDAARVGSPMRSSSSMRAGEVSTSSNSRTRLFGYDRAELLGQAGSRRWIPERFRARHLGHRDGYLADPRTRPMGAGLELAGLRNDGTEFPVDISLSGIETDQGRLAAAFVRDATEREARVELERAIAERRAVLAHLVSAGEEERRRIAGDIHDDSIQVMTAVGMRLQILRKSIADTPSLGRLDELEQTIGLSISRLRHLIFELRPPALDNEGLSAALRAYLGEVDQATETHSTGSTTGCVNEPAETRARHPLPHRPGGADEHPQARSGRQLDSHARGARRRVLRADPRRRRRLRRGIDLRAPRAPRARRHTRARRARRRLAANRKRRPGGDHGRVLGPVRGRRRVGRGHGVTREPGWRGARTRRGRARIRVLIADDDPAVRAALADLIESESALELVGAAGDATEVVALAAAEQPDVVLVDVRMPGGGGVTAARGIGQQLPRLRR